MHFRILRARETLDRTGDTRSPLYDKTARGLFTKPVKLGPRAAGWPEHEVDALVAARIAGVGDDDIRRLVLKLHEQRKSLVAGTCAVEGADAARVVEQNTRRASEEAKKRRERLPAQASAEATGVGEGA